MTSAALLSSESENLKNAQHLRIRGGLPPRSDGDRRSTELAPVAQWIERWLPEPCVGGSNPLGCTKT